MTHVRSEEVFKQKVAAFGFDAYQTGFENKSIRTISALAVSCGYQCENVPDADLVDKVIKPVSGWNGNGNEPLNFNNFRQLFWDCIQAHMADTRAQYDPRAMNLPARMASPDRESRRDTLATRYKSSIPNIVDGGPRTAMDLRGQVLRHDPQEPSRAVAQPGSVWHT